MAKRLQDSIEGNSKLWGGRFGGDMDSAMDRFNKSIGFDQRLWEVDIVSSMAYAKALALCGLISSKEKDLIISGLTTVKEEWSSGQFQIKGDEDIHSANERRLKEHIGDDIGGKLPTGRSRNDQVATDERLWLRKEATMIKELLLTFVSTCCQRAKREKGILMAGYTHLQRAQPIRWSHWLLSYAWYLKNDAERLTEIVKRTNVMPLGSGAIAGNPFDIDRDFLAKELGFDECTPNSIMAVNDRDFIAEFLFWCSLCSVHLSRWAEDLIIYSTKEFGFVTLSDAFSTGSSLMPQKKNADSLELIRGKSGRLIGYCVSMLVVLKGLPAAFNKDLQEDKEPLFDACDTMVNVLKVACGVLKTLEVHKDICEDSLSPEMLATDVAYYLVRKGVAFRDAHRIVGELVLLADKKKCSISTLSLSEMQTISDKYEEDISSIWGYERSVEQYKAYGGTAQVNIDMQINKLEEWITSNQV